jgi:hypothetical protein
MRMMVRLALYVGLVIAFILVVAAALVAHALGVLTDVAQWMGFGVLLVCAAMIVSSMEYHGISWNIMAFRRP